MHLWMVDQTKEQFLRMLQSERIPPGVVSAQHTTIVEERLQRGMIRVIWNQLRTNGVAPALIVIPEGDLREFFAWSNTYLGGWRPISGLFRVIAHSNLREMLKEKLNHETVWEYRNAVLGMIFGEAHVQGVLGENDTGKARSIFAGCIGTCSFAMGRAMSLGWRDLTTVAQNWHRARVATHPASVDSDVSNLLEPWAVLLEVSGLSSSAWSRIRTISQAVVAICRTLHKNDEIDRSALAVLTSGWPELEEAFRSMNEARERRVQVLDIALASVGRRRIRFSQPKAVALGLLASRIAPGSLDHAALLIPYAVKMRGLMLWYGLFSGMTSASRLIENHESLGRRILRDMLAEDTVFSRPSCDIAIDELEIFSMWKPSLQNIPRTTSEQLVIEIFPSINTVGPWLTRARRETFTQRPLFDDETKRLESDVRDLANVAERLLRRLRRLSTKRH